jgi:hypothetical protein
MAKESRDGAAASLWRQDHLLTLAKGVRSGLEHMNKLVEQCQPVAAVNSTALEAIVERVREYVAADGDDALTQELVALLRDLDSVETDGE